MSKKRSKRNGESRFDEILRRRKQMALAAAAVAVAIIVLVFLIRFISIQTTPIAECDTLTVKTDGSIELEEVRKSDKSFGKMKSYVKDLIKTYDSSHSGAVKLKRAISAHGKVSFVTTYRDYKTYADFTGYELYSGTVRSAKSDGYDINTDFRSVKNGTAGDYIKDINKKYKNSRIIIIKENIKLVLESADIQCISGDTSALKGRDTVVIGPRGSKNNASELTYIIFKRR